MNPNPLSSFSIISKTSDYFIMQHKETLKKSFYKEYFGSHLTEKEYNLVYDDFRRRKSLSNTSLISVYSYSIERQENIKNSPHYKFGLIYEFYIQNFQSELQPKLNTKLYWTQEELLNTLEATLQGLWELHKNGLTHGDIKSCNIVVNEEGFVKLADQFVTSSFYKKSIGQILEEKKAFLAPEILEICDNSFIETCENDLWAVGMVFLEAASLQEVNSVYDWEKKKIKKNVLEARIKIVKEIYDAKMSNIFEILLNKNSDERRKIYNLFDLGDIKQELKGKNFQESETQSPRFQSKGNLKQIDKSVQDYNENIEKNIEKESFNERNEDNNKINNSFNSEEDFIETKYNNVKEQYINYLKNEISKRQNSLLRLTDLLKKSESEVETSNSLLSIKKENKQIEKSPTLNNKQSSLSLIYDKYIKKSDENKIYSEKPSRQLSISSNPTYSRDRSTKIPDQSIDKCENSLKKLSLKLDQCLSKETNVIPKIFYDELESVRTINERSLIVNTMQSEICSEIKNENLNSILKESNKKTIEGVSTIRSFINEPDFPQNKSINHKNETIKQEYNNYNNNNNNNNSPYIEKPKIKKLVYENGEYYEGECIGTLRHGYGTCYSNAGKPIYQGEWAEDLYNGHGVKFNNSLNINGMKESTFYQDFNKVKNCWVKYEGNFLKGKKNGSGILVFLNNEYFQGSFLNDKIQGKGSFQTKFGKRVIGEWQNNKLVHKIN